MFVGDEVVAGVGLDIGAGFMTAIHGFKRSIYLFAGLSALLTLIVGLGMARTITRPINRLVMAAREIGRGNLEHSVDTSALDEIGYLGDTMEEMRQKLQARDAQLRQMLAGVAHEIRNPLGGIEIYAGLIAAELPEGDQRKKHIEKVIGEVRTLNTVISEFLEFARPSAAEPQLLHVAQLVEDAAFLLSPEMDEFGVIYEKHVGPELKAYVDPEHIKRALFNLMKNAVQAMEGGRDPHAEGGRSRTGGKDRYRGYRPGNSTRGESEVVRAIFHHPRKGVGTGSGHCPAGSGEEPGPAADE